MDLLSNEFFPFTTAAAFMLAIGAVQAIGVDLDLDVDADMNLLGWLGFGRLPFMMLVTLLLGLFAFIGFALHLTLPGKLSTAMSVIIAAPSALLGTAILSPFLARVIPQDETTSIRLEDLVKRRAILCLGTATAERPARAKITDDFGKTHNIWVQPLPAAPAIEPETEVLLTSFDPKTRVFTAMPVESFFRAID